MHKPITVKVRDAENIIFEGEVDRISSFNEIGRFDIFPMHANFISIIHQELTLFKDQKKIKEIKLEQAVLKAKQDSVQIFLGIEALQLGDAEESQQQNQPPKN